MRVTIVIRHEFRKGPRKARKHRRPHSANCACGHNLSKGHIDEEGYQVCLTQGCGCKQGIPADKHARLMRKHGEYWHD